MKTYEALTKKLVQRAMKRGAKQAEVFLQVGRQAEVRVRDEKIESLTQATSKGVGLRVFIGNRLGFTWTSDFETSSLYGFVDKAIAIAQASASIPFNGLPSKRDSGQLPPFKVNTLCDLKIATLSPDWKINAAFEMEKVLRAFDTRITAIDNVGAGEGVYEVYLENSAGVHRAYQATSAHLYAAPVASDGHQLQTSWWYDAKRFLNDLETPQLVAQKAASRAVRMLGARKVASQKAPVVFDPLMAADFLTSIANAAKGDAVYKKASFLAAKRGRRIAPPWLTLIDDGLMDKGLGTSPFDGEGVPTQRTTIVEAGVLRGFLYDAFTARKAKVHSTGNASRGYSNLPHIGTHNLYLKAGMKDPQQIIREVPKGLYVTAMLGHGTNIVTGAYSRGAMGLWIQDGAFTHPVQEVTVASNLSDMLLQLDAIGNDFAFYGSTGASTIRFKELTISGE